jgi:hypothetical protein
MPAKKAKKTQVYETTDFATFKSKKEAGDTTITKKTTYQTSNGLLFTDMKKAKEHQRRLDTRASVGEWVDKWGRNGMGKDEIADLIEENIDELISELLRIGIVKG